ncbi:MAG: four helix bundle protein [Flavobacteriales bacterium]|nr:four helix bundle protein [Flavobacteriales bacterium]
MDRDLQNRTKQFSIEIVEFYSDLPNGEVYYTLGKQLLRSGTSVGANTRSAFRGRSNKEFVAKLGVVIEEADESIFWLELLEKQKDINIDKLKVLKEEANELVSIFVSIVKKSKN